jgi:predicted aldo/keto reductase-like oxidoreductase
MYYYNYGDHRRAIRLFKTIPSTTRKRLANFDYSRAEHLCPQNIPIAKLMKKAVETLAKSEVG